MAAPEKRAAALKAIREELEDRVGWFEKHGRLLEAQRLKLRTDYDLELIEELGFCKGLKIIPAICPAACPEAPHPPCWISFPRIH